MKQEGAKEALARKLQCENNATSTRLRKFLGCGKEMSNATKNLNQAGKKTVNETSERTPVHPARPDDCKLSNLSKLEGVGKRQLFGGIDSPRRD